MSSRRPSKLSTMIDTRVRRLRGSSGSQSPQSPVPSGPPSRGTPVEVPEPSITSFTGLPC
jgi:hypothetical protein